MTLMNDEVLFATLIELADTTTTGFDLVNMSDRLVGACVEVLGVAAAGIMLADQRQSLRVFASSNEETRILELLELQNNDGPCLEAFNTGVSIDGVDLSRLTKRWPHFAAAAVAAGFNTAHAVPMRLRNQTIGALNLFQVGIEPLSARNVNVARVLADMAAIGIINHWSLRQQEVLAQQLESAINTRAIIEQAKGVEAERQGISPGEAFEYLRAAARSSKRPIAEVAIETVTGRVWTAPALNPAHGEVVAQGGGNRAVDPIAPGLPHVCDTAGLSEKDGSPEPRAAGKVERALEIVRCVYSVSPADALDLFSEITQTLNRSMHDLAIQVVAEGRLPEAAILRSRQLLRRATSEKLD